MEMLSIKWSLRIKLSDMLYIFEFSIYELRTKIYNVYTLDCMFTRFYYSFIKQIRSPIALKNIKCFQNFQKNSKRSKIINCNFFAQKVVKVSIFLKARFHTLLVL